MKKIISTHPSANAPSFSINGFEQYTSRISGLPIDYLVQNSIDENTKNYLCPITLEKITPENLSKKEIFALTTPQTTNTQPIVFVLLDLSKKDQKHPRLAQNIKKDLKTHPITREPLNITNIFQVRHKHWLSNSKYPYVLHSLEDWTMFDWLTGLNRSIGIDVKGVNPADIRTYRESAILMGLSILIFAMLTPELRFYFLFILLLTPIIPERHQGQR